MAKNKVFETKFGPMDMEEIDRLYNKTRYETFTHRASNEYGLPMYRVRSRSDKAHQMTDICSTTNSVIQRSMSFLLRMFIYSTIVAYGFYIDNK